MTHRIYWQIENRSPYFYKQNTGIGAKNDDFSIYVAIKIDALTVFYIHITDAEFLSICYFVPTFGPIGGIIKLII